MTFSSVSELLERIRELGPFADEPGAENALRATLSALGEQLTSDERESLAAELPHELAQLLRAARPAAQRGALEFYRSVAEHENTRLGHGIEHAQAVCRVLAETLSATTRLRRNIGELGDLFELPERPEAPEHAPSAAPTDLAEGRPGSTRPLATANPADLAHRHSVARSDDPHAQTRLSSAHGLRQEQHEHSLATGRPGSRRPLSSGH